jgi:hypothetical protein
MKIALTLIVLIWNYLGRKFFVFKSWYYPKTAAFRRFIMQFYIFKRRFVNLRIPYGFFTKISILSLLLWSRKIVKKIFRKTWQSRVGLL